MKKYDFDEMGLLKLLNDHLIYNGDIDEECIKSLIQSAIDKKVCEELRRACPVLTVNKTEKKLRNIINSRISQIENKGKEAR